MRNVYNNTQPPHSLYGGEDDETLRYMQPQGGSPPATPARLATPTPPSPPLTAALLRTVLRTRAPAGHLTLRVARAALAAPAATHGPRSGPGFRTLLELTSGQLMISALLEESLEDEWGSHSSVRDPLAPGDIITLLEYDPVPSYHLAASLEGIPALIIRRVARVYRSTGVARHEAAAWDPSRPPPARFGEEPRLAPPPRRLTRPPPMPAKFSVPRPPGPPPPSPPTSPPGLRPDPPPTPPTPPLTYGNEGGDDPACPKKLSDLTIHEIRKHLTNARIGDARPSCELNWEDKLDASIPPPSTAPDGSPTAFTPTAFTPTALTPTAFTPAGLPPPQHGFVPGSSVADNVALLKLVQACAEAEGAGAHFPPLTGVAQGSPTSTLFLAAVAVALARRHAPLRLLSCTMYADDVAVVFRPTEPNDPPRLRAVFAPALPPPPTPPPPPLTYGSEDDEAIRFTAPFGLQWEMRTAPSPPSDPSAPAPAAASDAEGSPAPPGNPPSVHDLLLNAVFGLIDLNERLPPGLCVSPVAVTPVDSEREDMPSDYDETPVGYWYGPRPWFDPWKVGPSFAQNVDGHIPAAELDHEFPPGAPNEDHPDEESQHGRDEDPTEYQNWPRHRTVDTARTWEVPEERNRWNIWEIDPSFLLTLRRPRFFNPSWEVRKRHNLPEGGVKHDCQEFYEDYGPHWEEADDLEDGELTHEQQAEHAPDQAGYEADDEERDAPGSDPMCLLDLCKRTCPSCGGRYCEFHRPWFRHGAMRFLPLGSPGRWAPQACYIAPLHRTSQPYGFVGTEIAIRKGRRNVAPREARRQTAWSPGGWAVEDGGPRLASQRRNPSSHAIAHRPTPHSPAPPWCFRNQARLRWLARLLSRARMCLDAAPWPHAPHGGARRPRQWHRARDPPTPEDYPPLRRLLRLPAKIKNCNHEEYMNFNLDGLPVIKTRRTLYSGEDSRPLTTSSRAGSYAGWQWRNPVHRWNPHEGFSPPRLPRLIRGIYAKYGPFRMPCPTEPAVYLAEARLADRVGTALGRGQWKDGEDFSVFLRQSQPPPRDPEHETEQCLRPRLQPWTKRSLDGDTPYFYGASWPRDAHVEHPEGTDLWSLRELYDSSPLAQFTMRYRHGTLPSPHYYGFPFILAHLPHRLLYLTHPPARQNSFSHSLPSVSHHAYLQGGRRERLCKWGTLFTRSTCGT